jgi:hypothetical protein
MAELQANIDDPSATADLAEVHASAAGLKVLLSMPLPLPLSFFLLLSLFALLS